MGKIVAFVTYSSEDAKSAHRAFTGPLLYRAWRRGAEAARAAGFAPRPSYVRGSGMGAAQAITDTTRMDNRRTSFGYDELLACARGELFGAGNAQLPRPRCVVAAARLLSRVAGSPGQRARAWAR